MFGFKVMGGREPPPKASPKDEAARRAAEANAAAQAVSREADRLRKAAIEGGRGVVQGGKPTGHSVAHKPETVYGARSLVPQPAVKEAKTFASEKAKHSSGWRAVTVNGERRKVTDCRVYGTGGGMHGGIKAHPANFARHARLLELQAAADMAAATGDALAAAKAERAVRAAQRALGNGTAQRGHDYSASHGKAVAVELWAANSKKRF